MRTEQCFVYSYKRSGMLVQRKSMKVFAQFYLIYTVWVCCFLSCFVNLNLREHMLLQCWIYAIGFFLQLFYQKISRKLDFVLDYFTQNLLCAQQPGQLPVLGCITLDCSPRTICRRHIMVGSLLPLQMHMGGIAAANKNDIDQHAVDTVCALNPNSDR
ncbi:uncharacterized protein LOC108470215 isoform X2 [Gossypium arboreum]|uniref:uncharacterized protein LOC108470215 isoform X2 n=1 Tax=Gossypium arboreum TaxID=29729 RepID=UPI0022F1A1E4|nr:uncharacterized protein LOC108470215 isoform X2 [Gossypium arboreum]